MRQNTVRLMLVLMLSVVSAVAYPQTAGVAEKNLGAMDYARGFLAHDQTVGYSGGLHFDQLEDNELVAHWGYFILNKDGLVSHLEIDETIMWSFVDGDSPISGIPFPADGQFLSLSVWLYGYASLVGEGETTKFGSFHSSLLLPGDPIVITMVPGQVMVPIYLPNLPAGVNGSDLALRWVGDDYAAAFWDSTKGQFTVWIDPLKPPTSYEIYNWRTGTVYFAVEFELGQQKEPAAANAGLNISNIGGVVELNFDSTSSIYRANQYFQSSDWDEVNQCYYPDSVFMSFLDGKELNLCVYSLEGKVSVEMIKFNGTVETVSMDVVAPDGGVQTLKINSGYEKVIIKITGTLIDEYGWGYTLSTWTTKNGGFKG